MKTLELNKMENVSGGDFGDVVNGACAAVGVASYVGWIAVSISSPVGWVVGGACLVNVVGNGAGWW